MTAKRNKSNLKFKHKKLIITISVIFAVIIGIISGYFIILKVGEVRLRNKLSGEGAKLPTSDSEDLPDDADAYFNGQAYYYNDNLINILLIGVDKNNIAVNGKHQADALYLISLDPADGATNVVAISRNTVTQIDVYDIDGDFLATDNKQICLSYVYGEDDKQSSELTVKSVSNLLYNVPINGYYTIFMDSISYIVDAVGGVPVHINEDMTSVSAEMTEGADVTVTGSNALKYLRFRKEINDPRFSRQKEFISSFVSTAKSAMLSDLTLPLKMYNKLAKNTVTDVDSSSAVYLASKAVGASFQLHSVPGTVGFDGTYETFDVENNQLYELILDVFYKKI